MLLFLEMKGVGGLKFICVCSLKHESHSSSRAAKREERSLTRKNKFIIILSSLMLKFMKQQSAKETIYKPKTCNYTLLARLIVLLATTGSA